jgi:hypothetical protein
MLIIRTNTELIWAKTWYKNEEYLFCNSYLLHIFFIKNKYVKVSVVRNVTPCRLVTIYQHFLQTYCFHIQGERVSSRGTTLGCLTHLDYNKSRPCTRENSQACACTIICHCIGKQYWYMSLYTHFEENRHYMLLMLAVVYLIISIFNFSSKCCSSDRYGVQQTDMVFNTDQLTLKKTEIWTNRR